MKSIDQPGVQEERNQFTIQEDIHTNSDGEGENAQIHEIGKNHEQRDTILESDILQQSKGLTQSRTTKRKDGDHHMLDQMALQREQQMFDHLS